MKPIKVMTIVGTRPEIIKLSRVIAELDKHTNHVLVHTNQNFDFELNEIFFKELEIRKPDHFLNVNTGVAAQAIGDIIIKADQILEQEKPDAVLLYGDTNSCLSAISAKRKQIPVFHMEAGNRCFDQRVPEEINRKIIDHISDINMTLSEHARRYLIAEGLRPETVFKIGSSMKEVFQYYQTNIEASPILNELKISSKQYFLVSVHREENVDTQENLVQIIQSLNAIVEKYQFPIVVSTHPRTRMRLEALEKTDANLKIDPKIDFLKPFGFLGYAKLQKEAFCVLSDSGSLTEDSSVMKFPGVMLRHTHERPEGMDITTVVMGGLTKNRVFRAIDVATEGYQNGESEFPMVPDYDVSNVSKKVLRLIISYTDYINDTVWHKPRNS